MNLDDTDTSDWDTVLILLSLDTAIPLYEEMGLRITEQERFVQLLREQIAESQRRTPSELIDPMLARKVLHETELQLGKQTAEHLYNWITRVFSPSFGALSDWTAWSLFLPYHQGNLPDDIILPAETFAAIRQFRDKTETGDLKPQIDSLRARPLSEWDAAQYSINQYSNREDPMFEDDFIDPFNFIIGAIEMNRFQQEWAGFWKNIPAEQKTLLWHYGQQFLDEQGIEMDEPLRHPDEIHRQL